MTKIEEHLIAVRKYIKNLNLSDIIAYKAFDSDRQLHLFYLLENARTKAKLYSSAKNEKPVMFKLEGYTIDINTDEIILATPAGMSVRVDDPRVLDALEYYEKDILYIKGKPYIRKGKPPFQNTKSIYLKDIEIYVASRDDKTAEELLKEYPPIKLLPYMFGYYEDPTVIALLVPRLLSIFQPFGYPIHVVYLSHPSSGKSYTAKILSNISRAYYLVSFPSRAKLIGDARLGMFGLCAVYDAIYIDEVDKINPIKSTEFRETYDFLLMGMEFGTWQREKSSRIDISYDNVVSFCFMGNIPFDLSTYSVIITKELGVNRLVLSDLMRAYEVNPDPFIQRIALVEIVPENISIMEYINQNEDRDTLILPPSISRSILEMLQDKVNFVSKKIRRERSRYDRYVNAIYNVLKVLGIEIDEATVERVVMGHESLFYVLRSGGKEEKKSEPTDLEKLVG